ncbi:MAG: SO2930 family diheme c-type cytochrome [Parvularculaceae bacterium]|nr:SO2930 family diheme c-type cytochrome [Parvularculaceae bacterium]
MTLFLRILTVLSVIAMLAACAREAAAPSPVFHAQGYPEKLSDWGLMRVGNGLLTLSARAVPYDLATPLFSDYALKLRTVTLPEGESAIYDAENVFEFPVGTVISKTFYYPQPAAEWTGAVTYGSPTAIIDGAMLMKGLRLIETRLLVRRAEGWVAIPYVWNEEQTDAVLARIGAVKPMTLHRPDGRKEAFAYLVPNQTQCAGCHAINNTTRAINPIGPKARHLNKGSSFNEGFNQLDWWMASGMLSGVPKDSAHARNVSWTDESASIDARARAYLDANCSHCHSDVGPADTSGLDLRPHVAMGPRFGWCKATIAAGGGSGGRPFDIVPGEPDKSIFVYRMETTKPGHMMPELGRAVTHEEGVKLIADWISAMDGTCA